MCNIEIKAGGRCFGKTVDLKIQELKRLQKEIDEANDEQDIIMQNSWGKGNQLTSEQSTRHEHLNVLKDDNKAKIKQIIEEL